VVPQWPEVSHPVLVPRPQEEMKQKEKEKGKKEKENSGGDVVPVDWAAMPS